MSVNITSMTELNDEQVYKVVCSIIEIGLDRGQFNHYLVSRKIPKRSVIHKGMVRSWSNWHEEQKLTEQQRNDKYDAFLEKKEELIRYLITQINILDMIGYLGEHRSVEHLKYVLRESEVNVKLVIEIDTQQDNSEDPKYEPLVEVDGPISFGSGNN